MQSAVPKGTVGAKGKVAETEETGKQPGVNVVEDMERETERAEAGRQGLPGGLA